MVKLLLWFGCACLKLELTLVPLVPIRSGGPVTVIDVTKYPVTGGVNMIEAQNKKALKIEKFLSFSVITARRYNSHSLLLRFC